MINQTDLINHSSFYIIWQRVLFTPYLFCDFFYKTKLIPLFFFGKLVTNFTGGKAALRTEIQSVQWNVFGSFVDSCNDIFFILESRSLGSDKSKYDFFVFGYFCKWRKTAGSFIIIFQIVCIYVLFSE